MFGVGELLSLPLPDNHQQTDSSDVVDRSLANLLTIDNYMPMPTPPAFPARGLYGHLIACMAGAAVDNVFRLGVSTALAALAATRFHAYQNSALQVTREDVFQHHDQPTLLQLHI